MFLLSLNSNLIHPRLVAIPAVGVMLRLRWINSIISAIPGHGWFMKPSTDSKTGVGAVMRVCMSLEVCRWGQANVENSFEIG